MCRLLVLLCLALPGCSLFQRDEQSQATTHTRERTVTTPLANGGTLVVREVDTDTHEHSIGHSGLDDALAANLANLAKAGTSAATGDWGTLIGVGASLVTATAVGYARSKRAEAAAHKADADEAWDRLAPKA